MEGKENRCTAVATWVIHVHALDLHLLLGLISILFIPDLAKGYDIYFCWKKLMGNHGKSSLLLDLFTIICPSLNILYDRSVHTHTHTHTHIHKIPNIYMAFKSGCFKRLVLLGEFFQLFDSWSRVWKIFEATLFSNQGNHDNTLWVHESDVYGAICVTFFHWLERTGFIYRTWSHITGLYMSRKWSKRLFKTVSHYSFPNIGYGVDSKNKRKYSSKMKYNFCSFARQIMQL